MTTGDSEGREQASSPGVGKDPVISDAESVLENLLDVVKNQAEEILAAARAEADSEAETTRAQAAAERDEVLAEARREATRITEDAKRSAADHCRSVLAVIEGSVTELGRVAEYRAKLEALAQQVRGAADSIGATESSAPDEAVADEPTVEVAEEDIYLEVNPEALQMLAGELGVDACREVIDTFVTELAGQIETLSSAAEAGDQHSKKLGRVLHNMSSGCATVGAFDLASLCNEITPDSLPDHIEALVVRVRVVRDEVLRVRDGGLSGDGSSSFAEDSP